MGNKALLTCLLVISFLSLTMANSNQGDVATKYPGLFERGLRSAVLSSLPKDQLLTLDSIIITRAELEAEIAKAPAAMQKQLTDNSFFLLEEMATQKILLSEAKLWAGLRKINIDGLTDEQVIQRYFEYKVQDVTVSEEDVREFYQVNPGIFGEAKFEEVSNYLKDFVLQEKKQAFISTYLNTISERTRVMLNSNWVKEQYPKALANPVNKARSSGKPTLVEFGASGCGPCDLMAPILAQLKEEYSQELNVEVIDVRDEQLLAARYGISSIPVQIFFDDQGTEIYRHLGFFSKEKIEAILAKMGVGE